MSKRKKVAGSTPPVMRPDAQRPTDATRQRGAKARAKARRKRCPVCGMKVALCLCEGS